MLGFYLFWQGSKKDCLSKNSLSVHLFSVSLNAYHFGHSALSQVFSAKKFKDNHRSLITPSLLQAFSPDFHPPIMALIMWLRGESLPSSDGFPSLPLSQVVPVICADLH